MYRLRDLREDNDLTQAEIAKALHVTQRAYSRYESGNHNIPTQILIQLSIFYETSIDYILGRTNNPKPPPK